MTRPAATVHRPTSSARRYPLPLGKLSRFLGGLFICIILSGIFAGNSLAATANTVIAVSCSVPSTQESFDCVQNTQTPVSGTFEYDITFSGDLSGQNTVDNATFSLRCPSAVLPVSTSTVTVWQTTAAANAESAYLGELAGATVTGIRYGSSGAWFGQASLPVGGRDFFYVEGTWTGSNAIPCTFEVYGTIPPSAYWQNQIHADLGTLHTDNTSGTQAVSCSACATSANQTAAQTANHTDLAQLHTDLTGTLATSCSLCAKDSTLSGTINTACALCSTNSALTSFSSANHSDLAAISTALGGTVTTSCGGCAQDSTLASFQTSTHSDAADIYKGIGWALGLMVFALIIPIFMRIFSRAGIR